ncbi:MAG: type III-B CRISPR module RAMP protein Cmr4 [Bryobacterales bacterium]|nr:type III-B CRISPR module RAMP protein Cmr4 [Bryobacterales bacterium]
MPANNVGGILYLQALTPLHPGSGTALGAVDLPVQRERHTDWPVIPGSSIKGVLREATDNGLRPRLFGAPDTEGTSAGALAFTDARILAFPVRSLRGVFAWVTCPQALQRWSRDTGLIGNTVKPPSIPIDESAAHCAQDSPCVHDGKLILEEFVFEAKAFGLDFFDALGDEERKRLVILDDTNFSHFVKYGTEVTARIRLEEHSKTAVAGALFYQEFVPAEALFYSLVLAAPSRRREAPTAEQNLDAFKPPGTIQIGGDETTGKGLCSLRLVKGAF